MREKKGTGLAADPFPCRSLRCLENNLIPNVIRRMPPLTFIAFRTVTSHTTKIRERDSGSLSD